MCGGRYIKCVSCYGIFDFIACKVCLWLKSDHKYSMCVCGWQKFYPFPPPPPPSFMPEVNREKWKCITVNAECHVRNIFFDAVFSKRAMQCGCLCATIDVKMGISTEVGSGGGGTVVGYESQKCLMDLQYSCMSENLC